MNTMTAVKKKELLDHLVKTQIVDAVMTMIKKNSSITMDGIARTCGIAKGSLYNYFKNKEDLMGYVHQAILEPIRESKSMILDSRKDPLTRLYEFIDSVFHINEDLHFYFRFMEQERSVAVEKKERSDIVMQPLTRLCRQGIEKGQFIDVAPDILAEAIYGMVIGPMKSLPLVSYKKQNLEKIRQDILRLIERIIIV